MNILTDTSFMLSTLVDVLRWRAKNQADRIAYIFLPDSGQEEMPITYQELDLKARAIGGMLQSRKAQGERVLLVYPSGLEFISAIYGCMYSGAIAVPTFPPEPSRINRTLPRLQAIAQDSEAKFALTTQTILKLSEPLLALAPDLKKMEWLASDAVSDEWAGRWADPNLKRSDLAFLQYTSGSTSTPKGVMVSYDNLCHDSEARYDLEGKPKHRLGVYWLPVHHDMGLIESIFNGLLRGHTNVILSPFSFLKDPFRWLNAISQYQATTTAAPNFAFDLCVRKISVEQRAQLDLSHWSRIYNGAEPIRSETLKRFAEYFAPAGFHPQAMSPCYGLAEATLIASGGFMDRVPVIRFINREDFQKNQIKIVSDQNDKTQALIGCGKAILGRKITIVAPETLEECPPNQVGEIWLAGPNNALGYWNKPQETKETFQAFVKNTGEGPFLRTGDVGFLEGGELFVTGRIKDLIIMGGQNHYAHDIELTVENCHPALRPGCGAAFTVNENEDERLVIVQEVDTRKSFDIEDVTKAIRRAVVEYHELMVSDVVLIEPKSIFKTSSGKIQRHACRKAYLDGTLEKIKVIKNEAI